MFSPKIWAFDILPPPTTWGVQLFLQEQCAWRHSGCESSPKHSSLQRHWLNLTSQKHWFCVSSHLAPVVSSLSHSRSELRFSHLVPETQVFEATSQRQRSWDRKARHSLKELWSRQVDQLNIGRNPPSQSLKELIAANGLRRTASANVEVDAPISFLWELGIPCVPWIP